MSVSPDFAPKLPAIYLREEHAYFVEASFEAVFYGITVTLYILTLNNLISKGRFKSAWKLITFLTVQQIAILIGVAGNIDLIMRSFVYNRNIRGGPVGYQQKYNNLPFSFAALAGFTIATWLQDGMMLYRSFIIWNGKYLAMFIFPSLMYATSILFSLVLLVQTGEHADFLSSLREIPVPMVFFSLSVSLNVILTITITVRLLHYRRVLTESIGRVRALRCVPFAGMVVESAALYSIVGIVQIVSLKADPAVATGIEGLYGAMTALASHMIAYRISTGRAWSRNTRHNAVVKWAQSLEQSEELEQSALGGNGDYMLVRPSPGGNKFGTAGGYVD